VNLACNSESKLFRGKTSSFHTDKGAVKKLDNASIKLGALIVFVVLNLLIDDIDLVTGAADHIVFNKRLRGVFVLFGFFFVFAKWGLGLVTLSTIPFREDLAIGDSC
jgi:hypothetical protein